MDKLCVRVAPDGHRKLLERCRLARLQHPVLEGAGGAYAFDAVRPFPMARCLQSRKRRKAELKGKRPIGIGELDVNGHVMRGHWIAHGTDGALTRLQTLHVEETDVWMFAKDTGFGVEDVASTEPDIRLAMVVDLRTDNRPIPVRSHSPFPLDVAKMPDKGIRGAFK